MFLSSKRSGTEQGYSRPSKPRTLDISELGKFTLYNGFGPCCASNCMTSNRGTVPSIQRFTSDRNFPKLHGAFGCRKSNLVYLRSIRGKKGPFSLYLGSIQGRCSPLPPTLDTSDRSEVVTADPCIPRIEAPCHSYSEV